MLNSPLDDAAAWKPVHAAAASSIKTIYTEPMWDSPLLWLVLGCCCLAEWAIRRKTLTAAASVLVFCLLAPPLPAVEPAASSRVLIIFGEPGDEEHLTEYKGLATLLQKTFIERFSLPAEHVILLTGWKGQERFCDRDTLLTELTATADQATAAAPSWIIFLGHSNPTAAGGKFNVPGQDPDAQELGAALKDAAGPLVIVHTTSSSGRFTRQLAGPGRTIISATLPGEEDNETDFGRLLPGVLADPATDADHDGTLSVIELFRACATTVTEHYKREGFVQKETPNLEADGDGRGTQRPSESDAKAAALIRLPISPP